MRPLFPPLSFLSEEELEVSTNMFAQASSLIPTCPSREASSFKFRASRCFSTLLNMQTPFYYFLFVLNGSLKRDDLKKCRDNEMHSSIYMKKLLKDKLSLKSSHKEKQFGFSFSLNFILLYLKHK